MNGKRRKIDRNQAKRAGTTSYPKTGKRQLNLNLRARKNTNIICLNFFFKKS